MVQLFNFSEVLTQNNNSRRQLSKKRRLKSDFLFQRSHGVQTVLDRRRFYEKKFRITPGARRVLQGNSNFLNTTEATIYLEGINFRGN